MTGKKNIKTVLIDFGGVVAEEGFKAGISAIAEKNDLEPEDLIKTAFATIYELGFITGKVSEDRFWDALRKSSGIRGTDSEFSEEILSCFILRPWMLELISKLKKKGITFAILSDQTNWLDELNQRYDVFNIFDYVFNSFHFGMTKKDPDIFDKVMQQMNIEQPETVLFIDDHLSHIKRAQSKGLKTIFYTSKDMFLTELEEYFFCPDIIKDR